MSLLRFQRAILFTQVVRQKRPLSTAVQNEEEYTKTPNYPPILDNSYEKKVERKQELVYEEIKAVQTVEEKQIKLNMTRYYGFKCLMFNEDTVHYDDLKLSQFATRTHLIHSESLPEYYKNVNVDKLVDLVKAEIEEVVLLEYEGYKRSIDKNELNKAQLENAISASICKQIHRTIVNNLVQEFNYLLDTHLDYDPRIEAFWYAGGMVPPVSVKKRKASIPWMKGMEDDPVDRIVQYIGKPIMTLRNQIPLKPIVPHVEALNPDFKVPHFKYDPVALGTLSDYKHGTNIPGYWPGERHQFGMLSYHNRGHLQMRQFNDSQDNQDAIHRQAILASFGWLSAQANFQGFTTFNDITYPIVTQTIITTGKLWSFYVYQLNTFLTHGKHSTDNPKTNICWSLPEMKLYDEIKDGKVVGINDEVLKVLLKYYVNAPEERLGVNLRPYLGGSEKIAADYHDDDKRQWLEREYKYLVANRPRHKLTYEIYHWEKIYKIDNKTRAMEKRRRPFELFVNPFRRRLDERKPFYIPRKLRPDLPKHKGRNAKEYFP